MATPKLEKISKDLAYKLQDPVASGTADGSRLTADNRLRYITRAYRRLLRIVTMLYPSLINKLFQKYYSETSVTLASDGKISISNLSEIFTVYCKQSNEETFKKAEWIPQDSFLDVKMGYNDFYEPDINTDSYYWSVVGGYLCLLPQLPFNVNMLYRPNIVTTLEDTGYGAAEDLDITNEHLDLLLSLATVEAYMDLGQTDLVNMHMQDANSQLQILVGIKQEKDIKDEEDNS